METVLGTGTRRRSGWTVGASLALSLLASTAASAATLSASQTDLNGFVELAFTGQDPVTTIDPQLGYVDVVNAWTSGGSAPYSATVGVNVAKSYIAGDVFKLEVANNNATPWVFQLFLQGATNSLAQTIANGASYIFSIPLFGPGTITEIALKVTAGGVGGDFLPNAQNNPDRKSEFSVLTVVPIPPALLLFASGIAGLGMLGWRRGRKAGLAVTAPS